MTVAFPIRFPGQLRPHLRALRKARGLTQAQLGAIVGVSQARIAEIEANPGLVNFEQLMKLLAVLGVTVSLLEDDSVPVAPPAKPTKAPVRPRSIPTSAKTPTASGAGTVARPAPRPRLVVRPKKGSW